MSEDVENGNGNRATVAMVLREVENLAKVTSAHFETVNVKLEGVTQIAARQDKMDGELRALSLGHVTLRDAFDRHRKDSEKRIGEQAEAARVIAEQQAEDARAVAATTASAIAVRRVNWWQFVPSLFALLIAIAGIIFH